MTTMPQCCKLCGAYQGKVYSISGTDKRFPALFKTVLRSGYALPHPNCRHEFIPWYEEIEAPEDVEKAIKNSKIQYDKNGELVDVRYQRDIKGYAEWQAGNRLLNRELLEYEQMKAHYAGREDEMPYKSLGAFRRASRAKTETYKELRKKYRAEQENTPNDLTNVNKDDIIEESPQTNVDFIEIPKNLTFNDHRTGKKIGKHAKEFGLNPSNADDREVFNDIVKDIFSNYEEIRMGPWRGQQGDVLFYIKGADVVLTDANGVFITILKGGIDNARVKNARKRKI